MKVGIVGMGWVGASVAASILHSGLARELLLDDAKPGLAEGEAMDLAHGAEPRSIHAQVVGEHGDSEVVLWSGAQLGGVPLRKWPGWSRERELEIGHEVRNAAYEIIARKGTTNHAIGLVTAALLRWTLRGGRRILTISRVQEGAVGIREVAISLPAIVSSSGAVEVIEPEMDAQEREALERSVEVLRRAYQEARSKP